jgi:hypothetical protein
MAISFEARIPGTPLGVRMLRPGLGLGLSIIATVAERLKIVNHSSGAEIHMAFPCPNAD